MELLEARKDIDAKSADIILLKEIEEHLLKLTLKKHWQFYFTGPGNQVFVLYPNFLM
jgi:hypothetical protein